MEHWLAKGRVCFNWSQTEAGKQHNPLSTWRPVLREAREDANVQLRGSGDGPSARSWIKTLQLEENEIEYLNQRISRHRKELNVYENVSNRMHFIMPASRICLQLNHWHKEFVQLSIKSFPPPFLESTFNNLRWTLISGEHKEIQTEGRCYVTVGWIIPDTHSISKCQLATWLLHFQSNFLSFWEAADGR